MILTCTKTKPKLCTKLGSSQNFVYLTDSMFFWSVAEACAAVDHSGAEGLHAVMNNFFVNSRHMIRVSSGGVIADATFPLTAASSHHYERLKGYYLSFSSVPLIFGLSSCLSFFVVVLLAITTHFCFNRSSSADETSKKRKIAIRVLYSVTLFWNLAFLFCVVVSLLIVFHMYAGFPRYQNDIDGVTDEALNLVSAMSSGTDGMYDMERDLTDDLRHFGEVFSIGNRSVLALGMGTGESTFDLVRSCYQDALVRKRNIDALVADDRLRKLYDEFINSVLPDSLQLHGDSLRALESYNRSDVFDQQLNKVFRCETTAGELVDGCLDSFEEQSDAFFRYLMHVETLLYDLITDSKDWKDLIGPKVKILLDEYRWFLDTTRSNVSSHFEDEYEKTINSVRYPACILPFLSIICSLVSILWLFFNWCPVTFASIVNAALVIAISSIYGYLMAYVGFMEQSFRNFDDAFINSTESDKNLYYGMFDCNAGEIGASTEFWNFTSGRELLMSIKMYEIGDLSVDEIVARCLNVLEPISYFYMIDGLEYRVPYYRIEDEAYSALSDRNIATEFGMLSSLYDPDETKTEEILIRTFAEYDNSFASAYNDLLGPGKPCEKYRLPDVQKCPIAPGHENYPQYTYLSEHRLTGALRRSLSDTHGALKEFSKDGAIYEQETVLLEYMARIIKDYLFRSSNTLSEAYFTTIGYLGDYTQFINESDTSGFGLFYGHMQDIVNASCMNVNSQYNSVRQRLVNEIPSYCVYFFISTFLIILIPCIVAAMNLWYKSIVRSRISPENRPRKPRRQSRRLGSTSSETTFCNDEAMNKVTQEQREEDEYSTSHRSNRRVPEPPSSERIPLSGQVPPIPELRQSVAMLVGCDFANMIDNDLSSGNVPRSPSLNEVIDPLAGFRVDDSEGSMSA